MKGKLYWLYGIIAVALAQLLNFLASKSPALVEKIYSRFIYPPLGRFLSRITAVLPISLAELFLVAFFLLFLFTLLRWLAGGWRKRQFSPRRILWILTIGAFMYALFTPLWGLNYYRAPLGEILGLEVRPSPVSELKDLTAELLTAVNEIRLHLPEDAAGVTVLPGGKWRALGRASLGYDALGTRWSQVSGRYGAPKGVLLSDLWSYTATAGMYVPYTGEAHVNMAMPEFNIPAAACHEMAHQRGFAREDEANYWAYLACINHPDREFQYSGLVEALLHSLRALRRVDPEAYQELYSAFGPGLSRDLAADRAFWQAHQGPVEEASRRMNDAYLKSNRQTDGVESYGRVVDLLLAARRAATDSTDGPRLYHLDR